MTERLKYHFEPQKGWINDPNGLCFYRGKYHAFFQHNPYAAKWDKMHWGHAVSDDMVHWEELPIAMYPDQPYENSGGCFSGSALVEGDRLWLVYTSVSDELGQTQSVAWTEDGEHFTKYAGNPVIDRYPEDGSRDFRDPKVFVCNGKYHMVLASAHEGTGRVLHYVSADMLHWDYAGILYENASLSRVYECTDLFPLDGRWVMMFSKTGRRQNAVQFLVGDFDGEKFTPETLQDTETGPHFYAPQTFTAPDGRQILIGWMHSRGRLPDDNDIWKGAFTAPRELSVRNGVLCAEPIREIRPYLTDTDDFVTVTENSVTVKVRAGEEPLGYTGKVEKVEILRDARTVEVFINGGERVLSYWVK